MQALSRRELLKTGGAGLAGAAMLAGGGAMAAQESPAPKAPEPKRDRWILALNASTIRSASLDDKISAAAKAGYDGIELWLNDLDAYEKSGKPLADLGKQIKDAGLSVPNIIGIFGAMPATDEDKAKAMDGFKQKMRQAAAVGGRHIAMVPGPDRPDLDILWAARRYAELVDAGKECGIAPALEFLSTMKSIHTLGQAAAIVMESGRSEGTIVADTFHMYNGGSQWSGVPFLSGSIYAVWHMNDLPAQSEAGKMKDADRIYPGDGVLPLKTLLKDLWQTGFRGPLSLELFSRAEWAKPPAEVAKVGIDKMRAVIAASGTGT
jgi:sugar phosphate isomerase/epimerase